MKKNTFLLILVLVGLFQHNYVAQNNSIILKSLATGSEGNTVFTDSSPILINSLGVASYKNSGASDDWSVSPVTINLSKSFNKTISLLYGGMSTVKTTEGNDYGQLLSQGGIDRDSQGGLGVRGGVSNAVDVNEGVYFGLDLSQMDAAISVQITKIYINFSGAVNENNTIVSRINPSKRITFGTAAGVDVLVNNGEVAIDISSFNLFLTGLETNDAMVSVFNSSPVVNNFRITGVELKVLDNQLDATQITSLQHPRLLLKKGEETLIHNKIVQSPELYNLHHFILKTADEYLSSPTLIHPGTERIIDVSRDAIFQLFYLSYAYRMTGNAAYLTKGESVLNTICDFNNWSSYTLDVAEMCFAVAIGYDWMFDGLSASTRQKAREKIVNYALIPEKNKAFWNFTSNWNQVGISGFSFGAMAILGDGTSQMDTEATFYLNNILVENPKSMNTYANGNYQEGAMYWSYGTTFEVMLLSTLEGIFGENHEGINRLTFTPGFLESAEYMQYVTGPTSLYFNYMDSTAKRTPLPATFWMAKKANNNSLVIEEKKLLQNGSYFTTNIEESRFLPIALIYGKDISLDNLSEPQTKNWVGYGDQPVSIVRTKWKGATGKYLGVKAGTPTYSHGQMDAGTFVYDSQGLRWGSDFGKYDYTAVGDYLASLNPPQSHSDYAQNSPRWDIFKVSNLNHNTISIKKSTETNWQRHKAAGMATIDAVFDTYSKRGAQINLKPVIGINNELNEIKRSIYLVDESYLEIKDEITNSTHSVDIYWNMVTTGLIEKLDNSRIKLTQGGKTVVLEIASNNVNVPFTIQENRSTDPVDYFPTATYERKNEGYTMIGFIATIPSNETVTFTVTIKDDAIVPPSSVIATNEILLEIPSPNTGLEGNSKLSDNAVFHFDDNGEVSISGISSEYAWNVYGTTNNSNALGKQFQFSWNAIGVANTNLGADYGAILAATGIDRDSGGNLGVRGGDTGGIDPNEGFNLGLDLLAMPRTTSLQLIKVGLDFIGGQESGIIVNRKDTSKKITFAAPGVTANVNLTKGFVDVESLGIILNGGETNLDIASVFSTSSSGAFRITKFVFKVQNAVANTANIQDNFVDLVPTGSGSEGNSLYEDQTEIAINTAGVISLPASTNSDWTNKSTGNITLSGARNKTFTVNWKGVAEVDNSLGENFGKLITLGGIDRANAGDLGIRSGAVAGIEFKEGYLFGFDLSNLSEEVTLQITEIGFSSLADIGEQATIVNRANTSKTKTANSNGYKDVSDLELYVTGGSIKSDLISVFGSSNNAIFRLSGLKFKLIETKSLPVSTTWLGINSDWFSSANWTNGLPNATSNVVITASTNQPIIPTGTSVTVNSIRLVDGASLIAQGTSTVTANVVYQRTITHHANNNDGWHLVSSPITNQMFSNSFANSNNLASSGTKRGFAVYETNTDNWSYLEDDNSKNGMFIPGIGYSIKTANTGLVSFIGSLQTENVITTISTQGNGYNLLGVPYTSYINSQLFLEENSNLNQELWLWNHITKNYETKIAGEAFMLAPTQGFFVKATSGTSVTFAETNQSVSSDTFQKSSKSEVKLSINDGDNNRFAKIFYLNNASKDFDKGFEGETFGGIKSNFDIYTHLIENSEGKNYQVQSLPISEIETMIVPVGIKTSAGKEITFTADANNLPTNIKVFLEDRLTSTITRLDEPNTFYKVTINEPLDGIGRFYLHTKTAGVLNIDEAILKSIRIYTPNNATLRIAGLPHGKATLKLFNILGKQLMQTSFISSAMQDIALPKLATGMYIVQLETATGKLNKKIVLE